MNMALAYDRSSEIVSVRYDDGYANHRHHREHCRWIPGHWRHGRWHPAHRECFVKYGNGYRYCLKVLFSHSKEINGYAAQNHYHTDQYDAIF